MQNTKKFTSYIDKYAPELRDLYLTLMPFEDVIKMVHSGETYNPQEGEELKPYFVLDFSEWRNGKCIIPMQFHVQKDRVFLKTMHGDRPSSLRQLHDFLRQLPRDPYAFLLNHEIEKDTP